MSLVTDLSSYRRQRETDCTSTGVVSEREIDPECANRSHYLIISESREAVQTVINGLIAEVESFGNGYGRFDGPHRFNHLYFATGNVVVRPDIYHPERPDV